MRDSESLEAFYGPRALVASEVEVGEDQLGLSPHLVPASPHDSVSPPQFTESRKATGGGKTYLHDLSDAPREIWAVSGYEAEAMVADRSRSDVWPWADHEDAASVIIVLVGLES